MTKQKLKQKKDKQVHAEAKKLADQTVTEFSENLHLQARIISDQSQDEVVLKRHVQEALRVLRRKYERQYDPSQELSLIIWTAVWPISAERIFFQSTEQPNKGLFIGFFGVMFILSSYKIFSILLERSRNS